MVDQRHPEAAEALKEAELDLLHLKQTFRIRDETEQEKRAAMQHEIDTCLLSRDGAFCARTDDCCARYPVALYSCSCFSSYEMIGSAACCNRVADIVLLL